MLGTPVYSMLAKTFLPRSSFYTLPTIQMPELWFLQASPLRHGSRHGGGVTVSRFWRSPVYD
jgi:hypothetical protein